MTDQIMQKLDEMQARAAADNPSTATGAAMSDVGFIPTTHQVREAYEVAHEEVGVPCDITGFDRWLNDIIRKAKAQGWDEGHYMSDLTWRHIYDGHDCEEGEMCPTCCQPNPYRSKDRSAR